MSFARRLEVYVGIPAWMVMAFAILRTWQGMPMPIWGLAAFAVFFAVWVFRFIASEKEFHS